MNLATVSMRSRTELIFQVVMVRRIALVMPGYEPGIHHEDLVDDRWIAG